MTILERKVFISSNPRIVLSSCPPPCGHFSIQESATGGLSYKVKNTIRSFHCTTNSIRNYYILLYKHIYIFLHRIKGKTLRNKERICLWKIIRWTVRAAALIIEPAGWWISLPLHCRKCGERLLAAKWIVSPQTVPDHIKIPVISYLWSLHTIRQFPKHQTAPALNQFHQKQIICMSTWNT